MSRNVRVVLLGVVAFMLVSSVCFAAKNEASKPAVQTGPDDMTAVPKGKFDMVAGTLVTIDNTDTANIKLEVKNDADGAMRTVYVNPWTNVTKVTDASDLKTGEPVRIMTRKIDDKDTAMGIMFGKLKAMAPAPAAQPQTAAPVKAKK